MQLTQPLPNGQVLTVGERGSKLSGGQNQRQRVVIARVQLLFNARRGQNQRVVIDTEHMLF